jgi:hypothetical protein
MPTDALGETVMGVDVPIPDDGDEDLDEIWKSYQSSSKIKLSV